jgi:predicted secreted Zn-dependent protease
MRDKTMDFRSILLGCTLAGAALVGAAAPGAAANLSKTYSYFSIGGTTLDEIQAELSKRGPHVKSTGLRHPGATQMEFNSHVGYAQSADSCKIVSATVSVKAKVILPRWRRTSKADGDVRFIWSTLESDIKRHEESHVVIAKNHARELEKAILAIGRQKTCAAASEKAQAASDKILAKHDREQQRFDRVEGINFESRLIRLMRYRLERAKAAQ